MKNVGYYIGYLLGGLVAFMSSIYIASKYISWNGIKLSIAISKLRERQLIKEIWKIGSLLFFYAFLFQLLFSIDKYFVKFLEGNRMLAFYTFAVQGTMAVISLFSAFVGSFAPKIYYNFAQGHNQEYLLKKLTFTIMILAYMSAFIIFIGARSFVEAVLPNYGNSVPFFKIFALMIIPFALYNIGYVIAVGMNRVLPLLKGITILLGIAVLLNWMLYKYTGINGIAWATVISVILAYFLVSFIVLSIYQFWYLTLFVLPILLVNLWLMSQDLKAGSVFFLLVICTMSFTFIKNKESY